MIQDAKPSLTDLVHFGVKGMKWGVRKPDKVYRSDKRAAKKNMKQAMKPVMDVRIKEIMIPGMSETTYKSLSTQQVHIKAGAEFYRSTPRKDEKLRDLAYFSYKPEDREIYRAIMPKVSGKKQNEYVYQATKDLRGPSEKERVDAFIRLLDAPEITNPFNKSQTMTGKEYLKLAGYGRDVKRLETQQLGLKYYHFAMGKELIGEGQLGKAYVADLQKKGYNLLSDDNDRKILSHDPVILLNPNGSVKQISVKPMTKKDINNAQKNFRVPQHGERRKT